MTDNSGYVQFIEFWNFLVLYGTVACVAVAILVIVFHHIKVRGIKDYKKKYEYINKNEIRIYRIAYIFIGIAVTLFFNSVKNETVILSVAWFFVRFFISLCFGTLIGYVSILIVKYYYPTRMQKKLDKWRYMPRVNPKTGNKMKLLSEEEEDVHLDEGMQAEEEVFSVDYDVWIDEETQDVKIEKYDGFLKALKCGSCGFQTLKIRQEEILSPATKEEDGELLKHYQCSYCKSTRTTAHKIARLSTNDNEEYIKNMIMAGKAKEVSGVKINIVRKDGTSETFDFQQVEQAEKFLKEYK